MFIVDADTFLYKAASLASNEKEARDALHSLLESVIQHQVGICVFTGTNSFKSGRFEVRATLPYQHSRPNVKPPLVLYLKDYVLTNFKETCPPNMRCIIAKKYEADDVCVMLGNQYPDATIYSEDKDLLVVSNALLTNYKSYGKLSVEKPLGYIELKNAKLIGRGKMFFWSQMLMGDTIDSVRGLSLITREDGIKALCGPVRAYNELMPYVETQDEIALANHVISLYRDINQNIIPEGWLLWLMPKFNVTFIDYLFTLDIREHYNWIHEQLNLDWYTNKLV